MATTQQLADAAKCYDCGIPEGMKLSILIYQLTLLTGVTDVQTLVNNAACYDCSIPQGMRLSVLIAQFDSWAGGTGGGVEVFSLIGSAVPGAGEVPPAGSGGVAYNEDDSVWVYNQNTSTWEQIIA